jgi:TPP-dependent indolepyruvate ferredoxin oxidoreductase alpha subunit
MGSDDDTSDAAAAAAAKKAKDAEKAKADKERSEKIQKWVESTTMDDVVWDDDEDIRILIDGSQAKNQKTRLQSIKGAAPALLMVPVLKKSFFNIPRWRRRRQRRRQQQ